MAMIQLRAGAYPPRAPPLYTCLYETGCSAPCLHGAHFRSERNEVMELYTNARFISCEKENRIYTAMAVKGGHIVWLGDESSLFYVDFHQHVIQGLALVFSPCTDFSQQ